MQSQNNIIKLEKMKVPELKLIAKKYDIKNVCRMKKDCLIENIKKQVALKMLDKNPFCKLDKSLFTKENYFNSSLERTPYKLIDVIQSNKQFNTKFRIHKADYKIRFKEALINDIKQSNTEYKINYIDKALNEMLNLAKSSSAYEKDDRISIALFNPNIKTPIYTGLRSDDILTNLKCITNGLLTSNEEIDITETTFEVQIVNIPRGSKGNKIINLSENIKTKSSIIQINNDDNLCCPRAIVVALSTQTNNILGHELNPNKIKQLKIGRKIQKDLALKLCNMLSGYNEEGFTLDDIQMGKILDIQINIICAESLNALIYKGDDKETKIYLYKNGNHFDVITSMQGFYGSSYYCKKCNKAYEAKDKHKCVKDKNVCKLCMQSEHLSNTKKKIYCEKCNRYCYNQDCLDNHFFVCMYIRKCIDCNQICKREGNILNPHIDNCGYSKCRNCQEEVKINEHQCYMQPRRALGGKCNILDCTKCDKGNTKYKYCTYTEKYLFFDYEAQQETGTHIANKIIAHDFEGNKIMFDTNEEFCKHVISEEYRGYTFIAHYAKDTIHNLY